LQQFHRCGCCFRLLVVAAAAAAAACSWLMAAAEEGEKMSDHPLENAETEISTPARNVAPTKL